VTLIDTLDANNPAGREVLKRLRATLTLTDKLVGRSPELESVQHIIDSVRKDGDRAVADLTERFDHVRLTPDQFRIGHEELARAHQQLDPSLRKAVQTAIANVRAFQEHILQRTGKALHVDGAGLRARYRPVRRAAVCVPGASAPLPSTAIHTIVPAQVAGVPEIVMMSPPRCEGSIHPVTLAVAAELGLSEVYRLGGAQAVAALALGTQTIRPVQMIVGPGNVYTQLAKKQLFGLINVDSFAGPSEVVIIADASAKPDSVAADMLAQAEHDPGSAILLTPDRSLAERVEQCLQQQLASLARREQTARCLKQYSAIVLVGDMNQAVELAEEFAPEHLEIETADAEVLADRIDSAGAIFIGHHSPEALGDYVAGPSHVLPTGGSAKFFSGLSCVDFLRRTSLIRYTPRALRRDAAAVIALAEAEGLDAHANSVRIRIGRPRT